MRRRRRPTRVVVPTHRGMCFQVASLADVDAGRDCECVLL
jgi:hypothetical protein